MNIIIRGARVHNLKNIDVEIPRDSLVVITGVSGSGKSSLAFDTVFAEGQRHYIQTLSTHARQFVDPLPRADVDFIHGLSPAIAVPQGHSHENPRSTMGTLTEIHDHLRLLFTHIGRPHCPKCGNAITVHTVQQIVDNLLELPPGTRIQILAPLKCDDTSLYRRHVDSLIRSGFVRIKIGDEILELSDLAAINPPEHADLMVDRLVIRDGIGNRLTDSIEVALKHGGKVVGIELPDAPDLQSRRYTQESACLDCGEPFPELAPQLFSFNSPHGACPACNGLGTQVQDATAGVGTAEQPCPKCAGARLRHESLQVRINNMNIGELSALSLRDFALFIHGVCLTEHETDVAGNLLREIRERTATLLELELGYLSLSRSSRSLSGGEYQRVRLAAHISVRLSGVIFVLDEPTVGLHPRDTARLLAILRELRDAGNTVLVVEHDRDIITAADYVIDMGPGAGEAGGKILVAGSVDHIRRSPASRTGPYLISSPPPTSRRRRHGSGTISLRRASRHNLKHIDVDFPIGLMTCVTGVSGSGKSSLVVGTLYDAVQHQRLPLASQRKATATTQDDASSATITGLNAFNRVLYVDQSAIGRSNRSTPATYGGLLDSLRNLFSHLPEARLRGYTARRFSHNASGGRCEACLGTGTVDIGMQFLPDVSVTCDVCSGRRYNRETLEICFKGASIADVLDLTVTEALELLGNVPPLRRRLESMAQVGLGYLCLGQRAGTLSGGEAQRIKLARELGKNAGGTALYLFDEPTTGLHFEEIGRLLDILDRLVESGHTVIAIEHNPEFLKCADYIVDLGPGGGEEGGNVIAAGTPREIMKVAASATGEYLKGLTPIETAGRD